MKIRTASVALLLVALSVLSLPAATPFLGVLRNVQGPKRNLILAKLEGGPLADTGVAQGMSGSPVYIDGRLIGAVSYSIGAFSKEAIAGITPIEEMKDATAMPRARTNRQARLELPVTRETLTAALTATY